MSDDSTPSFTDPFDEQIVQIDASLEEKLHFFAPTVGAEVRTPGAAETAGSGSRDPSSGEHNWVPIGPRNVGGRIRAIAIHPATQRIMYAAPAAAGIYKSLDGGETWFPLWHDEPSLSMAALAICTAQPDVVWAATGETQAGGGETIPASGVLRSVNGGASWVGPADGQAIRSSRIHAIAAHPVEPLQCWAATTEGLFRTVDGGRHWAQFGADRPFTDVQFARLSGALRLLAVPAGSVTVGPAATQREAAIVVRIDDPNATDAVLGVQLPAFAGPHGVDADPLLAIAARLPASTVAGTAPADGKLAVYPGGQPAPLADPVVYVMFANSMPGLEVSQPNDVTGVYGVFRSNDADAAATPPAMTFQQITTSADLSLEGQGTYNLALAVNPRDPNHLALGMVELYLNRNANAAIPPGPTAADWSRAQMWDLYHVERGHHADHHALVFAPVPAAPFTNGATAGAIALWDTNDGGVSWCVDWSDPARTGYPAGAAASPLPAGCFTWHKRSHGISCSQMYDLTQHPRLPSVIGCGFQDNGVYIGYGGPSWQLVLTADGGFVAFDPDDPYRLIATWQSGIAEARFPGRLREALPRLGRVVQQGLWPRELDDGFFDDDAALFVAETVVHPTAPGRVMTTRENRLYGTRPTTGDRWHPEPLGTGFDIVHRPTARNATRSTVEVRDDAGARALGLMAQRPLAERGGTRRHSESAVHSVTSEPYTIPAGGRVRLTFTHDGPVTGAAVQTIAIEVPLTVGPTLPASATAAQVAAYLRTAIRDRLTTAGLQPRPLVDVQARIQPAVTQCVLVSTNTGHARQIVLSGDGVAALSAVARTYSGADAAPAPNDDSALPAIAVLGISGGSGIDLRGKTMRVTRETGAHATDVGFSTDLADAAHATAADIVSLLRRKLPAAHYAVWDTAAYHAVRLTSAGGPITLTGDVPGAFFTVQQTTPATSQLIADQNTFDLSPTAPPAPLQLRVAEGANQTALQNFDAAFVGVADLSAVTSVELVHAIRRLIAGTPVNVRCDLDVQATDSSTRGEITELAFGPPGSAVVWAGDHANRLYRSTDDGETWRPVPSPLVGRRGRIDAIAVRPDDVKVVLVGSYAEGTHPASTRFLYRSTDGGEQWEAVDSIVDGADRTVGVRALVFDATEPDHAYAATDVGVFRSTNAGSSWGAFNQGLPNVRVADLTFEPATRMLRAGAWGRGVFERHVGERDARDVRLHVRSTEFDDASSQPAPGPDLLALRPASLRFDRSPDIKVFRRDPRLGTVLDGVEFDDDLRSGDVRQGPAFVAVQVHNRGAFTTRTARIAAMWAPADDGPPPLPDALWDALDDGPLVAGASFGSWRVIGDRALEDPHDVGHDELAPGYPRVVVFGAAPPFAWSAADLGDHRRVGILALARSDEDELGDRRGDVLALVRFEAKAAYRECAVAVPAVDDTIVLRSTGVAQFGIAAGAAPDNGADGAAPLGLSVVAGPVAEVRFTLAGPYDLDPIRRFSVLVTSTISVTFAPDEPEIADITSARADEVARVLDRHFLVADVPLRGRARQFAGGDDDAIRIETFAIAQFTVAGPAAATMGITTGAAVAQVTTPIGSRGPWNLSGAALTITVTATVDIALGPGTAELPVPASASAAEVRAAINRQLRIGGVDGIVAEPIRRSLSVRRSATESAGGRGTLGGFALADLVATTAAVAGDAARLALFDVVATHGADTIAAGANNHVYLRAANTGNVAEAAVRHRLLLLGVTVTPITTAALGAPVMRPIPAGASISLELVVPFPAADTGQRRFVLAIADVDADGLRLDPTPADLASIDALHAFCVRHPGAAIRELVVR